MPRTATKAAFATIAAASQIRSVFADAGVFEGGTITGEKMRSGDFTFDDIPTVILNATNFFLWFAGTVSVVMIIYGAFRLSLGSVESDKETAKKIIVASLIGFVLAVSSWAIMKVIMSNL